MTQQRARDLLAMIEIKEPNELIVNSWWGSFVKDYKDALQTAIKALEQQPCEDCISRQAVLDAINTYDKFGYTETGCFVREPKGDYVPYIHYDDVIKCVKNEPSVTPKEKTGQCKDCKYFEYDSMAKVNGIPLIVAHEICSRWGDGCKTREDGYCFLFESQESEVSE